MVIRSWQHYTVKITHFSSFRVIHGYYSNCTKTFFSEIAQEKPIAHDPSRKEINIQCYNCNDLFMHKGQDQVYFVEVYMQYFFSRGPFPKAS